MTPGLHRVATEIECPDGPFSGCDVVEIWSRHEESGRRIDSYQCEHGHIIRIVTSAWADK